MRIFKKIVLCFIFNIVFLTNGFSQHTKANFKEFKVLEVIQVNAYTYLRVIENDKEKWVAVPTTKAKIGDVFFYKGGMEMANFESKELNRTFKSVIFLESISKNKIENKNNSFQHKELNLSKKSTPEKEDSIKIEHSNGVMSISKLLEEKEKFKGQKVKIEGKVTKFNSQIMSKNWIHLQDGTAFNGKFDVTITSSEMVKLGDVVILEGIVSTNKDFGYGYFYDLIIENAVIVKN